MPIEFLNYLFTEVKDHMEQLKEEYYKDHADIDRVEYHFDKAIGIISMIEQNNTSNLPSVRVVGGSR